MTDQASAAAQRALLARMRSDEPRFAVAPGGPRVVSDATVDAWADELEALLSVDPGLGAPPQELCDVCERPITNEDQFGCPHCGTKWAEPFPGKAAALPSRVVPPDSGTVADVRAALGASLSNELAEAVLESRVVPPEPPPSYAEVAHKQSTGELLTRRLSVNDAEAQGTEPERVADQRSVSTIRPSAPDSDLDRLLRQARSASEGTTRYINDLGLALAHARETRPQTEGAMDQPKARMLSTSPQLFWATLRDNSEMPCLWGSLAEAKENCDPDEQVMRVSVQFVHPSAAAGGSPHAPQPPDNIERRRTEIMTAEFDDWASEIASDVERQSVTRVESAILEGLNKAYRYGRESLATEPPDYWLCKSCGCLWRDDGNYPAIPALRYGSVSLAGPKQTSCALCEASTPTNCEPLYKGKP